MTEASFKKPLFKKLATVRDYYEKTKGNNENDKLRSSASVTSHKQLTHWKKAETQDEKNYTHADAFNLKIVQKFDDLYQTRKGFVDTAAMENLAKRKHFFSEIEKQEV